MKTLKDLTSALEAAGCRKPRMERSYARRDHRETLVRAWIPAPAGTIQKIRKAQAAEVVKTLREGGFELTYDSWDYCAGESTSLWVMAKVALPEPY